MQQPSETAPGGLPLGVNLAGYLDSMLGVGQVARQVRAALESAGVAVAPFTVVADSAPRIAGGEPERASGPLHPVNLVCVNPDGLEGAHDSLGADFFAGRHTIGLWWWEVDAFPDAFRRAFDLVDEVWVGSHHVADALAAVSPVPVVRMPVPVEAEPSRARAATELGLPAGGPLFLFAFDHGGGFERKNPLGAIEAFTRAFEPGDGPQLVVKCIGAPERPDAHRRLLDAAARARPRARARPPAAPRRDMAALTEALRRLPVAAPLRGLRPDDRRGDAARQAGGGHRATRARATGSPSATASRSTGARCRSAPATSPIPPRAHGPSPTSTTPPRSCGAWSSEPDEARRRAERGRRRRAGGASPRTWPAAAMAARLARVAGLPLGGNGATLLARRGGGAAPRARRAARARPGRAPAPAAHAAAPRAAAPEPPAGHPPAAGGRGARAPGAHARRAGGGPGRRARPPCGPSSRSIKRQLDR